MTTMTIRNLDDDVKTRLRLRAAQHGHSMEEEARRILSASLKAEPLTLPASCARSGCAGYAQRAQFRWLRHRTGRSVAVTFLTGAW
ncbi:MAG: FitA-like ribbon-helix-helix domain-containing protein [Rhodanobacteraceae bacterium]